MSVIVCVFRCMYLRHLMCIRGQGESSGEEKKGGLGGKCKPIPAAHRVSRPATKAYARRASHARTKNSKRAAPPRRFRLRAKPASQKVEQILWSIKQTTLHFMLLWAGPSSFCFGTSQGKCSADCFELTSSKAKQAGLFQRPLGLSGPIDQGVANVRCSARELMERKAQLRSYAENSLHRGSFPQNGFQGPGSRQMILHTSRNFLDHIA